MSRISRARLVCAALILAWTASAYADSLTIDLAAAHARAREQAPDAITAHAKVAQARAAGVGARIHFEENPNISMGPGVRNSNPLTVAADVRITQPLEIGHRSARIAVADAGEREARAETEAALRELDLAVTLAFNEARHADLAVEAATLSVALTTRSVTAADKRHQAGELSDLDFDLAKIALGRARATLATTRSNRAEAIGKLAALIGARPGDAITLRGDLGAPPPTLEALRAALANRPDIRALDAEAGVARAEGNLAHVKRWPALGLWFGYLRDQGDDIFLGGLSLTLPVWNREQGNLAAARVKENTAMRRRSALFIAAARQLEDAYASYQHQRESLDTMEREILPVVADAQKLVEKSIDAGQISVSDLLVIRQEVTTARREYIDRQLDLANSVAQVLFIAGVTP
ncbi:MAG: TolC family protein [Kofleriaceae bacterium]|nr:TolC family protein [Kofleriaceae bacterium]